MTAGQDLRGTVQTGLVEQTGFGRWTKYILKIQVERAEELKIPSNEGKILSYILNHGSINNSECRRLLNVNEARAYYLLKKLSEKGKIRGQKKGKGRRYTVS